jgi:hypothetical protein
MANGMSTLFRRDRPYLPGGHALTGARDTDPLPAVLDSGLAGLTVAVRPGPRGELFVGDRDPQPGRTLRRLVLSPLFERAGSGGGRLRRDQSLPFRLVIEFAGPDRDPETLLQAYRMLDRELRDRATLLSRCVGGLLEPGAVTVSVAGIIDVREVLVGQRERYVFADGGFDDVGDPAAPPALVPMINEPWRRRFGWDGREPISAEERHQLHALVRAAHQDGRTVRIGDVPAGDSRRIRRAFWDELTAAGVDAIADADHRSLAGYLRGRRTSRSGGGRPEPAMAQPA